MSEVVLAYPATLINEILPEGVSSELTRAQFAELVVGKEVWDDRAKLKAAARTKQAIDYCIYIIEQYDNTQPQLVAVYQRAKTVGEEKLMGNLSFGFGGHVDDPVDRVDHEDGTTDFVATLDKSWTREKDEEITIELPEDQQDYEIKPIHLGWVNDNSNAIGQVHFAALTAVILPAGTKLSSPEANQVMQEPVPFNIINMLKNPALESWSALVRDWLLINNINPETNLLDLKHVA